jgi:alkylation response protein AidB-like acyl-CoA dehydrogenase
VQAELEHEELELILDTIKRYGNKRLDPVAIQQFDQSDRCPTEVLRELMGPQVGIHLAFIPTAFGGLGGGAKAIFRICEAVARIDLGIATSLLGVSLGTDPLRVGGTQAQKERWMTRVAEEGMLVAYAVTEPAAGSDLAAIRTRATPIESDGQIVAYRINGTKQFITNGSIADLYTVLALTPGGPTFFVIERGTPGLTCGAPEHKHGIRASNTTSLTFEDVQVPIDQLIGGVEGQGLTQATQVFGYTRVMVAAFGLACGCSAIEKAIAYGADRVQDGSPLNQKAAWTHKLIVPHAVALEAARAFIEQLADRLDQGEPDLQPDGAIAKLIATEAGNAAAEAAIQAHGGYGYIADYQVEKIKRDVRITCIYEGTSEILQRVIARDRWRLHLQSRGEYYQMRAEALDRLSANQPGCGGRQAARAMRALAETIEVCRQSRLTRNQHVLFSLGLMMARAEAAEAFAHKVALGAPDTSRLPMDCLKAMSRLWARKVASQVIGQGLELVFGADALQASALTDFENRMDLSGLHAGLAGNLADLSAVAQQLTQ